MLPQILGRQLRQHLAIDVVVAECGHIVFKAQPAQPRRYVHAVILGSEESSLSWTRIFLCPLSYQPCP